MQNSKEAIRQWILGHDDSWAFIICYIALAVVLTIWISLFWLIVVVGVHALFEWVCQHELDDDILGIVSRIGWELKLDAALIIFALCLGVYMDVLLGMVGLGAAARAGVQGGARFAVWQNVLHGTLMTVDDAAQVARMVAGRKSRADGDAGEDGELDILAGPSIGELAEPIEPPPSWSKWGGWVGRWSKGDWFALGFAVLCTILLVIAPTLTDHDTASVLASIAHDLHPWPSK
ncbi:MAG: hypothetical protein H0U74_22200 [Bradymonadaceae bacterium]|nr:hypothetical protein [Lujinxingiaceae bacterium]